MTFAERGVIVEQQTSDLSKPRERRAEQKRASDKAFVDYLMRTYPDSADFIRRRIIAHPERSIGQSVATPDIDLNTHVLGRTV